MRHCPGCKTACGAEHRFCHACGGALPEDALRGDADPLLGRTLPGGFRILELIGIGGMGRVYRAEQTVLNRTVAVKVIHPHLLHDESTTARFLNEARACSLLNHPNCVSVIDLGRTEDGTPYLVMQLLRGRDLARVVYEDGPLAFSRIASIVRQVLAALAEAHHHGIIHRDLKPENVIVERDRSGRDFVRVVDFGLAKLRESGGKGGRSITSPGTVCGTPDYMAPEQGRGDPIDGRSDLYGIGVILFQLLTGRLPFEAESSTETVLLRQTLPAPDPRLAAPTRRIPDSLARVTIRALEPDPDHRWPDADRFGEALERVLAELESIERVRAPRDVRCRACGGSVPATQRFCGECGQRMPQAPQVLPASDPRLRAVPAIDGPKLPLPLLAREADLGWLRARCQEIHASIAGARIVGEAGVGKTRLLREFLLGCAAAGDVVVRTGPDPWWSSVGYWALRQAVCGLASIDPRGDEREWTGASSEARRGLLELFGRVDATSLAISADQRRWIAAEALRWAFVRAGALAGDKRIVLVVDDLHQIDGASLHAFADVLLEPPLVGALLVGAHVPTFEPGWPVEVPSHALSGVPASLVERVIAGVPIRASAAVNSEPERTLAPLYVEQLVRFGGEGGTDAPERLADLVALRMERLGNDARQVMQALAVLGDDVSLREVQALVPEGPMSRTATGTVESMAAQSIAALVAAGLVEQTDRGLRHAHPLVREIAGAMIPAAVRRELHARAARLAQAQRLPLEALALHAVRAEDAFEGLLLIEQVAERALARGDADGAADALRRGLELASSQPSAGELADPVHASLLFARKLGEALTRAGRLDEAQSVLEDALATSDPTGPERARVLRALASVAHQRHRAGEATRWLQEALDHAARSGAHELVASLEDLRRGWTG